jgi:hypothetical protein
LLEREMADLKKGFEWEFYHGEPDDDDEADGTNGEPKEKTKKAIWKPNNSSAEASQPSSANVKALYCTHRGWNADQASKMPLEIQNPCDPGPDGIDGLWISNPAGLAKKKSEGDTSDSSFGRAFVAMPPVMRYLRELMLEGNPSVTQAFAVCGLQRDVYGVGTLMKYAHKSPVGGSLSWHYDKSLGLETACISVPTKQPAESTPSASQAATTDSKKPASGVKTIGLGGHAPKERECGVNAGSFVKMTVPANAYWGGNAHAVYHAVGCEEGAAATVVFRTLLSKRAYQTGENGFLRFAPEGGMAISKQLRRIKIRYMPVVGQRDTEAVAKSLQAWETKVLGASKK